MTRATAQEGLQSSRVKDSESSISRNDNEDPETKNSAATTIAEEVSSRGSSSETSSSDKEETPETLQPNGSGSKSVTTNKSETKETKSAETTKTTASGASLVTVSASTVKPTATSKSVVTSKPATTSKPVTTSKPATTQKPTTTVTQKQVVDLPYNVYCNDTPETGSDEQYIKALYWNCYLRYYDLGQVNNSEIALQKSVIAAQGREYLKYEVMMKSDEFQCIITAGSCDGIAAKPTISANKVGRCASVNDYKFGGVPNASSIRVDHACNR